MTKGNIVKIKESYRIERQIPIEVPGLVLRPPYEKQIQLTETLTACEIMIDILVGGKVFSAIPVKYCSRIKKQEN